LDPKHTCCSRCGMRYGAATWPRTCPSCGGMEWGNPVPVAVVLQPVDDGFLVGRRAITPGLGKFGLPGGFVDRSETFRQAAARELMEEMRVGTDHEALIFFGEYAVRVTNVLLTFWLAPPLASADLAPFVPNEEVSERAVMTAPTKLAFESHTLMLKRALEMRGT